jgi:hypothetical protein
MGNKSIKKVLHGAHKKLKTRIMMSPFNRNPHHPNKTKFRLLNIITADKNLRAKKETNCNSNY